MKNPEIEIVCSACGKNPPINAEKSNQQWNTFDTSKPCSCGGKWALKINGEIITGKLGA